MDECGSNRSASRETGSGKYYSELERLRTYKNWGLLWYLISPIDLARWGWISIDDKKGSTQCVYCGGIVTTWAGKAGPKDTHLQLFPNCPLLTDKETIETANIPFSFPAIRAPVREHTCGCFCCYSFR
jgi:hypothetical protein